MTDGSSHSCGSQICKEVSGSLQLTGFINVLGFLGGVIGKEPICQCWRHKRLGFDPWIGKIPWRRAWQPTPVFLENSMDRGAWEASVHRVTKSCT